MRHQIIYRQLEDVDPPGWIVACRCGWMSARVYDRRSECHEKFDNHIARRLAAQPA